MNIKKYLKTLLSSSAELAAKLGTNGKILSAYPAEVTIFPCVIYEEQSSSDICFSDNMPEGTSAVVRIHIFSKTLTDYPTTNEIGDIIRGVFRSKLWAMTSNNELSEEDQIKHRVMDFKREFYSL